MGSKMTLTKLENEPIIGIYGLFLHGLWARMMVLYHNLLQEHGIKMVQNGFDMVLIGMYNDNQKQRLTLTNKEVQMDDVLITSMIFLIGESDE